MSQHTAKNYPIHRAPKRIELLGDKTTRIESAEHIIEFPGGAIEVARTTDGQYWAHIIVHRGPAMADDGSTRESIRGEVVGSRIQCDAGLIEIPHAASVSQIAVLVGRAP